MDDPTTSDQEITVVDPSQTPYSSSFPTANYAYLEGPTTAYRYFNLSTTKMERIGSWSNGNLNAYSDPQVEYVFPLELGVFNNDIWASTASSFGGTYNLKCVGYGTLILPNSTYNNALMVWVEMEEAFLYLEAYFWYSADNGADLLQYIIGDGFIIPDQGTYLYAYTTTGLTENEVVYDLTYNNPIDKEMKLNFQCKESSNLEYTVINGLGKIVHSGNMSVTPQQRNELNLDFRDQKAGLYYVIINSDNSNQKVKTIKVIKM